MISQTADDLLTALYRESVMHADNLGLRLTAEELRWVKDQLHELRIRDGNTRIPTMGEYLQRCQLRMWGPHD